MDRLRKTRRNRRQEALDTADEVMRKLGKPMHTYATYIVPEHVVIEMLDGSTKKIAHCRTRKIDKAQLERMLSLFQDFPKEGQIDIESAIAALRETHDLMEGAS